MEYSMKAKALCGAFSFVGIFTEAICLPIYFVIACVFAVKCKDARNYFVGTFYGIGYGIATRAMYVSAMVLAAFDRKRSDEFYVEARKYHREYIDTFDSLYS